MEVRNYLQTKSKYDSDFRVVCPLVEESKAGEQSLQRFARDLSESDIEFIEQKDGFVRVVSFLIETLKIDRAGCIGAEDFDDYLDFSQLEYGKVFDD